MIAFVGRGQTQAIWRNSVRVGAPNGLDLELVEWRSIVYTGGGGYERKNGLLLTADGVVAAGAAGAGAGAGAGRVCMADTTKYISMCRCGEVAIELTGSPMASLHCHCTICQMWTGAPYQWLVLFPTNKTTVVKGDENIEISKTSEDLDRARCKKCTSHVYNNNKPKQAHAVPGVAIQGIRSKDRTVAEGFAPTAEMFYGTRVEDMTGGLPTFDGYPPL
eukprot:g10752.t1